MKNFFAFIARFWNKTPEVKKIHTCPAVGGKAKESPRTPSGHALPIQRTRLTRLNNNHNQKETEWKFQTILPAHSMCRVRRIMGRV